MLLVMIFPIESYENITLSNLLKVYLKRLMVTLNIQFLESFWTHFLLCMIYWNQFQEIVNCIQQRKINHLFFTSKAGRLYIPMKPVPSAAVLFNYMSNGCRDFPVLLPLIHPRRVVMISSDLPRITWVNTGYLRVTLVHLG